MPEKMQKIGLLTLNAWAIDGFQKIFWRDEPVSGFCPQVAVLLGVAVVFFLLARQVARGGKRLDTVCAGRRGRTQATRARVLATRTPSPPP